jgi:hypothetical protein
VTFSGDKLQADPGEILGRERPGGCDLEKPVGRALGLTIDLLA